MGLTAGVAVFSGAGLGALLRWVLGHFLNPVFPTLPLGTLAANVLGGLLMGLALGAFSQYEAISPTMRLAMTTGFLGGLTTFSTFSAEVTTLLQQGRLAWAGAAISVHVLGSLAMTLLGMASMNLLQRVP